MDNLKMFRYTPEQAKKNIGLESEDEFFEPSPKHGDVVAIYAIVPKENVTLFISEYKGGIFWTIAERIDVIGSLTKCIDFLLKEFV